MSAARKYLSSGKAEKIIGRKAAEKLLATLPDNNADCIYLTVAEVYTSEFKRVDYGFSFYNQRTGQRESGTGFVPFDEGVIVKSCAAVFDTDDRFANYNDYTKYLSKEVDDLPENATYYTAPYWKDEGEFEAAYRTKDELYSQFAAAARQPIGEKYGIDIKNVSIRITSPDAYKLTKKGSGYNVIDAYIPFYVYEVELGGVFYCVRVNAMNLHTEVFKTKNKETRYGQFDKKTDPYEAKDEKGRKIKKTMKDRVQRGKIAVPLVYSRGRIGIGYYCACDQRRQSGRNFRAAGRGDLPVRGCRISAILDYTKTYNVFQEIKIIRRNNYELQQFTAG